MNRRNIQYVLQQCAENSIYIISMREHLTPEYLTDGIIRLCIRDFVDELTCLIISIIGPDEFIKPSEKDQSTSKPDRRNPETKKIMDEIRAGREFDYIGTKYNKSKEYLGKLKSQMIQRGENLPDRRKKQWRQRKIYKW